MLTENSNLCPDFCLVIHALCYMYGPDDTIRNAQQNLKKFYTT